MKLHSILLVSLGYFLTTSCVKPDQAKQLNVENQSLTEENVEKQDTTQEINQKQQLTELNGEKQQLIDAISAERASIQSLHVEIENLREQLNNLKLQHEQATLEAQQIDNTKAKLAKELGALKKKWEKELKGLMEGPGCPEPLSVIIPKLMQRVKDLARENENLRMELAKGKK